MLTPKQLRFVEEYLAGSNGAQAAIRAGYSAKTARAIASENLKKPAIRAVLDRHWQARQQKFEIQTARVIDELARIAFSSIKGVLDELDEIRNPSEWPEEVWDGIASVRFNEVTVAGPKGTRRRVKFRAKVKMGPKLKALDLLAEYLGMYRQPEPEPTETTYTLKVQGEPPRRIR